MEILAVDNHSDDESIGFMRAHLNGLPNVTIVETRDNLGYGRGNNAASRQANGEYILIINPDNVLPKDGVERMLSFLQSHPDTGIVGPALVYPDGAVRPSARPFPKLSDLLRKRLFPKQWQKKYDEDMAAMQKKDAADVDWMVGACLLLSADLYKELGGFDQRYFLFFEDIDLCRRIKRKGLKVVYLPSVRVLDRRGRLSGSSIFSLVTRKTTRIHFVSALQYFWKWAWMSAEPAKRP